jgi:hypothetical protein
MGAPAPDAISAKRLPGALIGPDCAGSSGVADGLSIAVLECLRNLSDSECGEFPGRVVRVPTRNRCDGVNRCCEIDVVGESSVDEFSSTHTAAQDVQDPMFARNERAAATSASGDIRKSDSAATMLPAPMRSSTQGRSESGASDTDVHRSPQATIVQRSATHRREDGARPGRPRCGWATHRR